MFYATVLLSVCADSTGPGLYDSITKYCREQVSVGTPLQ